MDAADYVLSRFLPEEREQVEDACDRAARAVELWVREGLDAAMNRYNRTSPQGNTPGGPDR
jgi:PTH1 family peptidyl-tRNA hydrolase